MEQTFVLLNWTQFPGLFSMVNKKQDQFKDHRIVPDVYKPEEMRKFNFRSDIRHRYTSFSAIYLTVISYFWFSLIVII